MDITKSALLTDLYQLATTQAYIENGKIATAVFEFFARRFPPPAGSSLPPAGEALHFLEDFKFSPEDIEWLASTGRFNGYSCEIPRGHALHGRCACHARRDDLLSR